MATDHASGKADDPGFSFGDVERGWNTFVDRVDRVQRRHRPLAFSWGVWKRFMEDRGNHYAALLSFYTFFTLFPLVLVLVTILGFVLVDHPGLRDDIVNSAVGNFPVIGEDIQNRVTGLHGNGFALAFGILTALWGGLGAVEAFQHAMNTMWSVPQYRRPNILKRRLRDLAVVGVLGLGVIGATAASAAGAFVPMTTVGRVFSLLGTVVVNVAVILLVFQLLTGCHLELRRIWVGATIGGAALVGLQVLGGVYVRSVLQDANDTYGVFAAVIGLMTWLLLQARILLLASEVNVVLDDHLWPRGMSNRMPTEADLRAYRLSTEREERLKREAAAVGMAAPPLDTT
jgi:YihY family inner membrane protein